MFSRLSRRLAALLCTSLFVLTILLGTVVTLPSGFASSADYPPGPYKSALDYPPGPYKSAFNPQLDPPGKIAGIIIQGASGDGIIIHD